MRVPRRGGAPIPGLYAAGGSMAGLSGDGAGGYCSGNGLVAALFGCRLAAGSAASLRLAG